MEKKGWLKNAVATINGYRDPKTNELLKCATLTQEFCDEWNGVKAPKKEEAPVVEEVVAEEEAPKKTTKKKTAKKSSSKMGALQKAAAKVKSIGK